MFPVLVRAWDFSLVRRDLPSPVLVKARILQSSRYSNCIYFLQTDSMSQCVLSSHLFWTSGLLDVPAGVTQEEGQTEFIIHLPSAVLALFFLATSIQPFLSLVDREVEFCVLTN